MLALAEGLAPYADKQAFIYRRDGTGKAEIAIPLDQIMKRKAKDVVLSANDILYIPDNKGRRLGTAALEKILLCGSTAGATALIYHPLVRERRHDRSKPTDCHERILRRR